MKLKIPTRAKVYSGWSKKHFADDSSPYHKNGNKYSTSPHSKRVVKLLSKDDPFIVALNKKSRELSKRKKK